MLYKLPSSSTFSAQQAPDWAAAPREWFLTAGGEQWPGCVLQWGRDGGDGCGRHWQWTPVPAGPGHGHCHRSHQLPLHQRLVSSSMECLVFKFPMQDDEVWMKSHIWLLAYKSFHPKYCMFTELEPDTGRLLRCWIPFIPVSSVYLSVCMMFLLHGVTGYFGQRPEWLKHLFFSSSFSSYLTAVMSYGDVC